MGAIGVVVIGRNEGDRLRRCLLSARGVTPLVYVDSGSTDASVGTAHECGAAVVCLDLSVPFTAARARNIGFERVLAIDGHVDDVQFVDGDCELQPGWLAAAAACLEARPEVAAVAGRLRERHPEASIYNRLCDLEWDGPVGDVPACGGIAIFRRSAFEPVGGFRPDMIAGEEPELCVRLRERGWKITRLPIEMALHDADMHHFSQWWRRAVRTGHAYAEGAWLHGLGPLRHNLRQVRSVLFWAGLFPLLAIALAWLSYGVSVLVMLAAYAAQSARIAARRMRNGERGALAWLYAVSCVVAKFAHFAGIWSFVWHTLILRRRRGIIEYKQPAAT